MQYGVPENYWDEPGFRRTLTRLASFSRLIMLDPRGLGASEGDRGDWRVPEVSDADLIAVLDAAGAEQAILIGHSFGGYQSIHFAAAHPSG
jgi:pimeloyl-ACP methyl ester carboxylesterase